MTDAPPPRPDDGTEIPILSAPRKRASGNVVAVIIVSFIAFAVMIAIVVNAMLNTQQQQVKNLFQNVQHCIDYPKDPVCDLSVAPSP
jgi:ABC-type lipoprotein release transport system permease subunit